MTSTPSNQEPSREKSEENPFLYRKQNSERRVSGSTKTCDHGGGRRLQLPKTRLRLILSPIRFLKRFAGEIARSICMVSSSSSSSSGQRKSLSRSGKSSFTARSKPFVAPIDSHRVEAIEDCIQFINCTLSRSNSAVTNS